MRIVKNGFYVIKNSYFENVKDPYLKDNKNEKRPFYYCVEGNYNNKKIYWMIPLSSKVEKFKNIIIDREQRHKPNDGLYICKLPNGKESVFLIQDIFPISINYIEREYTLGGNHLVLRKEKDILIVSKKSKKIINLVLRGIKITPTSPNILKILNFKL